MTDPTETVEVPVVVPGGTPTTDAVALSPTALRYALMLLGAFMSQHHWIKDETVNDFVSIGVIVVTVVWGLLQTRLSLKTKQALADLLPDNLARVKGR